MLTLGGILLYHLGYILHAPKPPIARKGLELGIGTAFATSPAVLWLPWFRPFAPQGVCVGRPAPRHSPVTGGGSVPPAAPLARDRNGQHTATEAKPKSLQTAF